MIFLDMNCLISLKNIMSSCGGYAWGVGVFFLITLNQVSAQAVIEGRVPLPEGKVPPVMVQRYQIVTKGKILAPDPPVAIVYLEGEFSKTRKPVQVAQMLQKDLVFDPGLLAVQVGTKVEFPNLDDSFHNVFSFSKTKRFDLGRYLPDERPIPSKVFDKPGLVTLRCDIHEHMRALILVVDTPYFITSDTQGKFRLEGLPAGKWKLKAWLNSKKTIEIPVELEETSTLNLNFP